MSTTLPSMNGYNFQAQGTSDDRQPPPSIPSLNELQIERPLSAASPNPSQQLPPLHHQSFPSTSTYLPPLSSRSNTNGAQHHHHPQGPYALEKTATLSQIAPQQPFGAQPYNPYAHQYPPPQQNYPPPPTYLNGDSGHASSQHYPSTLSQPPPYVESHHNAHNLLPPFNPQPPQQQLHVPPSNGARLQDPRPVPVVGSQGRRGVLPSAPGRPPVTQGGDMRGQLVNNAQKGADGKYACQYCSKVYLHLKHLKRHHLRHTGERPYQCSLCKETFCRSDILKRHFQKCSIRRGNPTGATHLTHAQAHLNRTSRTPSVAGSIAGAPQANGVAAPGQPAPPSSYKQKWPNGSLQMVAGQDPGSARTSRSSSIAHRPSSSADDRKSFPGVGGTGPHTGQTSLNTSPSSSSGEDRKYNQHGQVTSREGPPSQFHDQQQYQPSQHSQQYASYYGSNGHQYPSTSQPETFPSYGYGHTNGYPYQQQQQQQQHQQNQPEPTRYENPQWSYQQFFQPGSQDPVMSYQQ